MIAFTFARLVNLALLGLFPVAWMAPIARAESTWLFFSEEITMVSAVLELYEADMFLAGVVALFAFALPYLKTIAMVYVQFSRGVPPRWTMPFLEMLARFSMTDVFLVAFLVVLYRGVGDITVEWGLYVFTGAVIASIIASWITHLELRRRAARRRKR